MYLVIYSLPYDNMFFPYTKQRPYISRSTIHTRTEMYSEKENE